MRFSTEINISNTDSISLTAFEMALKSTDKVRVTSKSHLQNRIWYSIECESVLHAIMFGKHWQLHEVELRKED